MPDEDEILDSGLDEGEAPEEGLEPEVEDQALDSKIEERLAALEMAQRQSVLEIRSAVGRVQSLASQLDKTNDPQVEAKLRTELTGVTELLGLVTESIDESILPRDVKRRVADTQAAVRAAAADAEINRRIAEATRTPAPQPTGVDPNQIEAAVVSQIRGLGLNDQDPAFDWSRASQILVNQGESAMWNYFGEVEKQLLTAGGSSEGPTRRPRSTTAPRTTGATPPPADVATQLENAKDIDAQVAILRSLGINV